MGKLAIQLTTPLLLRKPCKRFASVARVCQRQLAFLVITATMSDFKILSLSQLAVNLQWSDGQRYHNKVKTLPTQAPQVSPTISESKYQYITVYNVLPYTCRPACLHGQFLCDNQTFCNS